MNRVPFDIKYKEKIQSGKYQVQTKDGHNVRVVCWDADEYFPIVVIDSGIAYQYNLFGKPMISENESDDFDDLVVVTKTESESDIITILKRVQEGHYLEDSKNDFEGVIEELKGYLKKEIFRELPTADLEKELKNFHDIFRNKDIGEDGLKNWASLIKLVVQKIIEREKLDEK